MDCGAACLRMIAEYHGKHYTLGYLRNLCSVLVDGVSLHGLSEAAEKIGFRTMGAKISFDQLNEDVRLPCILHWNQEHFVVIPPQDYSGKRREKISIVDPAYGAMRLTKESFLSKWISAHDNMGIALILEPTPKFYSEESQASERAAFGFFC